jgi:AcrR family transcriptional regulator
MIRKARAAGTRNRKDTEAKLVSAAAAVLARDGFSGFGVNAVAREAGVDKVLVYRYFDDVNGLMARLGQEQKLWLGHAPEIPGGASYADALEVMLSAYLKKLRSSAFLRQALLLELSCNSELSHSLMQARSKSAAQWFRSVLGERTGPKSLDAPAINAVVIAGLHMLTLAEGPLGRFAGLELKTNRDWNRVADAVKSLLRKLYD